MPLSSASAKNSDKASMIGTWMTRKIAHPADPGQEERIGEGPGVVLEAGEARATDQLLLEQRQVPGVDQRDDDHGDEDDEERQHQA